MKNAIKEYLSFNEEEKRELWNNAVFVFDTNIFLNLYRYTEETRENLLKSMQQLSDRIWMPKQVAQELMKDRTKVIFETLEILEELKKEKEKFIKTCREKLRREQTDEKIENMSKGIDQNIESLISESNYIENVEEDPILKQLLKLYDKKVGDGFSKTDIEKIKEEGIRRYEKQVPPGYKDYKKGEENNAFGDLIIWKEILEFAKCNKKDIIYVTGDKKEDWWDKVNGRILGPRVELKREFYEETKQLFYMYSMNGFIVQFTENQGAQIQQKTIDEVVNYERLIEKNSFLIMREREYRQKMRMIRNEKVRLQNAMQKLENEQESLKKQISDLKIVLNEKRMEKHKSVEEIENINMILSELREYQVYSNQIMQRIADVQKEIESLEYQRKELIILHERREKEFDQL